MKKCSLLTFLFLLLASGCSPVAGSAAQTLCFTCTSETCAPAPGAPPESTTGTGLFTQGDIDLTGDGVAEHVRLDNDQLLIEEAGVTVWQSPAAWHIVDAALGDPNDDGRYEILIAFWKLDDEGIARSHPFIIGYRGGHYYEIWGGSAVKTPIHEVEIGDVDGDGIQELIVLEGSENGSTRAVAVWRWNQWWFNIVWRSPEGDYRSLQLPSTDAPLPHTCVMTQ